MRSPSASHSYHVFLNNQQSLSLRPVRHLARASQRVSTLKPNKHVGTDGSRRKPSALRPAVPTRRVFEGAQTRRPKRFFSRLGVKKRIDTCDFGKTSNESTKSRFREQDEFCQSHWCSHTGSCSKMQWPGTPSGVQASCQIVGCFSVQHCSFYRVSTGRVQIVSRTGQVSLTRFQSDRT